MPIQLNGTATFSSTTQEVETTRAARVTVRSADPGALGSYSKALISGTIAAGMAANAPVFSFRYTGGAAFCLVRRITISLGDLAGFTAGFINFNAYVARAFSASDTTGTVGTLTGNNGKLRTTHGVTAVGDIRIGNTGALSPGTRTLDTDPFATASLSAVGTAGQPLVPAPIDLWRVVPGEQPLVLANNEGFVIQGVVPATGTWQIGVTTVWDELASW